MSDLEGDALLAEVRARIAGALRGVSGAPYEAVLLGLPQPMRVVLALDSLRGALSSTAAGAAIDRRFVTDAIEALMRVGLHPQAFKLAELLGTARAVPAARIESDPGLAAGMRSWNRVLAGYLEERRSFRQ